MLILHLEMTAFGGLNIDVWKIVNTIKVFLKTYISIRFRKYVQLWHEQNSFRVRYDR